MRIILAAMLCCISLGAQAKERVITKEQLIDKVEGFWMGQMLGNYIGFPFENLYIDEAIPLLVDRVFTADYDGSPELMTTGLIIGGIYLLLLRR